ncbi:hypothetical protein DNF23_02120 [Pseudomonas syringae pv. pisi]
MSGCFLDFLAVPTHTRAEALRASVRSVWLERVIVGFHCIMSSDNGDRRVRLSTGILLFLAFVPPCAYSAEVTVILLIKVPIWNVHTPRPVFI